MRNPAAAVSYPLMHPFRKNIVFRADASSIIGSGHVMRCATLAAQLQDLGAEIVFVCSDQDGNLAGALRNRGFRVELLDRPAVNSLTELHDATATEGVIRRNFGNSCDWLIVDHYSLGKAWETSLRSATSKILVIDDLADREHDSDILIDQNEFSSKETRYARLVGQSCKLLLGARYALLHPDYSRLHGEVKARGRAVGRILIYFGGSDLWDLTGMALRAFLSLGREEVMVDVGLPGLSSVRAGIEAAAKGHRNVRLHGLLPSLAPLMLDSDIAIGAGARQHGSVSACGCLRWL